MTNPNKRKGDAWERIVVQVLQAHGLENVERALGAGRHDDRGDIHGLGPRWYIDCKDHGELKLSAWLDSINAKKSRPSDFGVIIAKRRRALANDAYAILTLDDLARLIAESEGIDPLEWLAKKAARDDGPR